MPINISTTAILVSPGVSVSGTISITAAEVYFEVDEDHAELKKLDPQVSGEAVIREFIFKDRRKNSL